MKELSPEVMQEIVERLSEALDPISIYLFGSHAFGTPDRDSDVDLLVVVADGKTCYRELARQGRRSLWGMRIPVDLIVCTLSELEKWSNAKCNLIHTVVQTGRLIYGPKDRTGCQMVRASKG